MNTFVNDFTKYIIKLKFFNSNQVINSQLKINFLIFNYLLIILIS